jgi:AAA domain
MTTREYKGRFSEEVDAPPVQALRFKGNYDAIIGGNGKAGDWPPWQSPRPGAAPRASKIPPDAWKQHTISAPDLCDKRFPDVKFIVPDLFPEGVMLLASRPKLGKSWLLLQVCSSVASGVITLVGSGSPVCGDALYMALEDGERRVQRRMTKYFGGLRDSWPSRLTIATKWRRLDQGGLDDIRAWCKSVECPTLAGIDTLKRVRPPKRKVQSDYAADYEASEGLLAITHEFPGLLIVSAHHDRKMDADDVFDTVSGTLGLTAGVDTLGLLKRTAQGVTLHIQGRDLLEDVEKAVCFDRETCRWVIRGEAAEVYRSDGRAKVLAALLSAPAGMTVDEIKVAANIPTKDAAHKTVQRMALAGEIRRIKAGVYALPTPLSTVSTVSTDG